eukprot:Blabericola_migrator_1__4317@NODE_2325_length_2937_cov_19_200697_g1458_i0_p2_GENE_NODE_2325_length_2937_cov_19_200697_g1458_i0NODE_2325_length_2937_cov_19_200697_g1458_i0_p2_ORF_typecomplete_len404_score56_76_NODE_2325_length_2937_cov_19_200697_g1458_i016352846
MKSFRRCERSDTKRHPGARGADWLPTMKLFLVSLSIFLLTHAGLEVSQLVEADHDIHKDAVTQRNRKSQRPLYGGKLYEPWPGDWPKRYHEAMIAVGGMDHIFINDAALFYIMRHNVRIQYFFERLNEIQRTNEPLEIEMNSCNLLVESAQAELMALMRVRAESDVSNEIKNEMMRWGWNDSRMARVAQNVDERLMKAGRRLYDLPEIVQVAARLFRTHNEEVEKDIQEKWIKDLPLGLRPLKQRDRDQSHLRLFQSVVHFLDISPSARNGLWKLVKNHKETISKIPAYLVEADADTRIATAEKQAYIEHIHTLWESLPRYSIRQLTEAQPLNVQKRKFSFRKGSVPSAKDLAKTLMAKVGKIDSYEFCREAANLLFNYTLSKFHETEEGEHVLTYLDAHDYI